MKKKMFRERHGYIVSNIEKDSNAKEIIIRAINKKQIKNYKSKKKKSDK